MDDSHTLIRKMLITNDCKAMEILYDRFASLVYGVLFKVLKSESKAEELLNNVFSDIWKSRAVVASEVQNMQTVMIRAARKIALQEIPFPEYMRKQHALNGKSKPEETNHTSNDGKVIRRKTILSKEQERLMDLFFYGGGTLKHVSLETSIPEDEIKKIVRESVQQYKKASHQLA